MFSRISIVIDTFRHVTCRIWGTHCTILAPSRIEADIEYLPNALFPLLNGGENCTVDRIAMNYLTDRDI